MGNGKSDDFGADDSKKLGDVMSMNHAEFKEMAVALKTSIAKVHGEVYYFQVAACADMLSDIGIMCTMLDPQIPSLAKDLLITRLAASTSNVMLRMSGMKNGSPGHIIFCDWVHTLVKQRDATEKRALDQVNKIFDK